MKKITRIFSVLAISLLMIISLDTNLVKANAIGLPTVQLNLTNIADGVNTILIVAESAENIFKFRQTITEASSTIIPLDLVDGTYRFRVVGYLASDLTPTILSGADIKDQVVASGSTLDVGLVMGAITISLDSSVPASVISGMKFTAKISIHDPSNFMEDAGSITLTTTHGTITDVFDASAIKESDMTYTVSKEITTPSTLGNFAFSVKANNSKFLTNLIDIGDEKPEIQHSPYNIEVVAKKLTSITIDVLPTKSVYIEGDVFDGTGLKVVGHYDDSTTAEIAASDYSVSGFTSTVGQKTITITSGGFEATFNVSVNAMSTPVLTAVSGGYNSIITSWAAVNGATDYEVWRSSTATGVFVKVITVKTLTYSDATQTLGKIAYYKVRAIRIINAITLLSPYSAVKSATPIISVPTATAASASYTSIRIGWAAIAGASGYEVYRSSTSTGVFTLLASTTSTSYTNITLTTNTAYYYKVRVYRTINLVKTYSGYSAIVSARPVPAVPTGVTTASASYNSIKTSWIAVAGASGYEVSYALRIDGLYTVAALTAATSYTTLNLLTNTSYFFKVRAYRLVGTLKVFGLSSAPVTSVAIPVAPTITVSSASFNSLKIGWTAVAGANGYEVFALNGAAYELINDTPTTSFIHDALTTGVVRSYKVRAYRLVDSVKVYSKDSLIVSNKPIPAVPTSLKAGSSAYNAVSLNWIAVNGATGYEIFRSTTTAGVYVLAGSSLTASFMNSGLATNSTYYYKIRSYTLVGTVKIYSGYTTVVSAKPIPSTPIASIASASYNSIRISWTAVSGATKYEVWRSSTSSGVYTLLTSITPPTISYTNISLVTNTAYYYKVRAYRLVGIVKVYSSYSSVLSARPVPAVPTGVISSSASYNSAKVTWTAVTGASGYEVQKSESGIAGSYTTSSTTTSTYLTIGSLNTNVPYYFIVRAYRLVGTLKVYGNFSASASSTPIPNTPILAIASSSFNSLYLSWPVIAGASGYELKVLNTETSTFDLLSDLSTNSYTHMDLVSGVAKTYMVVAYVTSGETRIYGNPSTQIAGTPIPSAPGSVLVASASYNSAALSWTAVDGAIGYEVSRSLSATGTFTIVSVTDQLDFMDTALITNTVYYYKVRAITSVNSINVFGKYTAVFSVRPIPATPTASVASTSYISNQISWSPIDGANGYEIYSSSSSAGIYTLVTATTATFYTHTGLTTNTLYYYKVRTYRTVGTLKVYSGYSAVISCKPIPSITTGVSAVSASYNSIKTTWTAVTGATGYEVYRSETIDSGYVLAGTSTTTSYTSGGLITNKPYFFYVRAYRMVGTVKVFGGESTSVTSQAMPSKPVLVVQSISYKVLQLSWASVSGSIGYEVYRLNQATGLYELFADTPSTSMIDDNLVTGTAQSYYVRAYVNVDAVKIYSENSSIVTKTPIPGTSTLVATVFSWDIVALEWSAVEGISGYEVYGSIGTTGIFYYLADTTSLIYFDEGRAASTSYSYKVRAYTMVDTVKVYGNDSTTIKISTTAEPKYSVTCPSATVYSTWYITLTFKNSGAKPMVIYSEDAWLEDYDYYSYDRELYLVNSSNVAVSSISIAAGATVNVKFAVSGYNAAYYEMYTYIHYGFRYDGTYYIGKSSYYFGSVYL